MSILADIQTVRKLEGGKLTVRHYGRVTVWDPEKDKNWQDYKNAREQILKHKMLGKILDKLGII